MHCFTPQANLASVLQKASSPVDLKTTVPVLSNVRISVSNGVIEITGTDLDVEMSDVCQTQVESEGVITCNSKRFVDIVKAAPKDSVIEIKLDDSTLLVKYGRSKFKIQTLPADDFPLVGEIASYPYKLSIKESELHRAITFTAYAMANNDVRYYLNGMSLSVSEGSATATLAATDGHRLSTTNFECIEVNSHDASLIVPRDSIAEMLGLLSDSSESEVELLFSNDRIKIEKDNWKFSSKLIEGKYPDYRAAMPQSFDTSVSVDKSLFAGAVSRAMILQEDRFKAGTISVSNNSLVITSVNVGQESAKDVIDISYSGDPMEVSFNFAYLHDVVRYCEGDTLNIDFNRLTSSKITGNGEAINIVMPVKI